ncbi:hypothetical protein [Varibaculum cambriense]|uniref:hypothetical protein n=1 Tax=Varibaculum cambriense TaxID=184870 RepID=UPI0029004849|nr:hypothetical protein [Varibaculum cambriense]MDU1223881.1 hypothetical protein [Varibaculum cambriense]
MANRQNEEETAEHSSDAADITSLSKATLSPSENGQENASVEAAGEDEPVGKQEPREETAKSGEDNAADDPAATAEDLASDDDEEKTDDQFEIPEILPLAGGREANHQADPEAESEESDRVWGNQAGGRVDREEVAATRSGSAFDVDQIALKKTEQVRKTHSRSRTVISWVLGIAAIVAAIGLALYASGIWQKVFTPTGASSPQEGAQAYYGALLDKDAETICALSSKEARGELVQAVSQKTDENSVEQCTQAVEKAFAESEQSPTVKLDDLVFTPESKADVGGGKAVLIKDKQGTPLQIMAWQEDEGRWFLAGQNLQQQVMMKYQQSLVAGGKDAK